MTFRVLGDGSTGPLYSLTFCLSAQGMLGVDGVQGSKGNIVSMVEVGDSGPRNKDPSMTSLLVCNRGLREKWGPQVSRETLGLWYEQRRPLHFKGFLSPTEIMETHLSYRAFLGLRA